MADVAVFCFNDFQENTYLVYDDTGECIIIDPGCNTDAERTLLTTFIAEQQLRPVQLLNTHCHIDHVLGNAFVSQTYSLPLASHKGEAIVLSQMEWIAKQYGIRYETSPDITRFLAQGDELSFGRTKARVLFTPGHSPASICFYFAEDGFVIAGDVLFRDSIGRTDLLGGDLETLMSSIKHQLLTLPGETVVWPGHGPQTSIQYENANNPFIQSYVHQRKE